jgi:hypothetical protein
MKYAIFILYPFRLSIEPKHLSFHVKRRMSETGNLHTKPYALHQRQGLSRFFSNGTYIV